MMRVNVLAFAGLRELLGGGAVQVDVPDGTTVDDLWAMLCERTPALRETIGTTRIARNGRVVAEISQTLRDGDELALLPPFSGG